MFILLCIIYPRFMTIRCAYVLVSRALAGEISPHNAKLSGKLLVDGVEWNYRKKVNIDLPFAAFLVVAY